MEIKRIETSFKDNRGEISDILDRVDTDCLTLITSKKGARRGDHYHELSKQYAYVLSGKMRLITQMPGSKPQQTTIVTGDLVYTPPLERHAFIALEDSAFLAITRGPRGGKTYEDDTYRLPEPLPDK